MTMQSSFWSELDKQSSSSFWDGLDEAPKQEKQQEQSSEPTWGNTFAEAGKAIASGSVGGAIDQITSIYNLPAVLNNALHRILTPEQQKQLAEWAQVSTPEGEIMSFGAQEMPLIPSATHAIEQGIDTATGDYTNQKALPHMLYKGLQNVSGMATGPFKLKPMDAVKAGIGQTIGEEVAGPVGGIMGAVAADGLSARNLTRAIGLGPNQINSKTVEAARRQGLMDTLEPTAISDSNLLAFGRQMLQNVPVVSEKIAKKDQAAKELVANALEAAKNEVGPSLGDYSERGKEFQKRLTARYEKLKEKSNQLYDDAEKILEKQKNAVIEPKHTEKAIKELYKKLNDPLFKSGDRAKVTEVLNTITESIANRKAQQNPVTPLTYDTQDNIYSLGSILIPQEVDLAPIIANQEKIKAKLPKVHVSDLTETIKQFNDTLNWELYNPSVKNLLKKVRSGVEQDITAYGAKNSNNKWWDKYQEAKQHYGEQFNENAMGSETARNILQHKNPEKIVSELKEISDWETLKAVLPEDFPALKQAKISEIFEQKFVDHATGEVKGRPLSKIINDPQQGHLLRYLTGDATFQKLQDLTQVAHALQTRKVFNPSGSGMVNMINAFILGMVYNPLAATKIGISMAALPMLYTNKRFLNLAIQFAQSPKPSKSVVNHLTKILTNIAPQLADQPEG